MRRREYETLKRAVEANECGFLERRMLKAIDRRIAAVETLAKYLARDARDQDKLAELLNVACGVIVED